MSTEQKLKLALEAALGKMAHTTGCAQVNPTEKWAQDGIWNFDKCQCAISIVRAALALPPSGDWKQSDPYLGGGSK